MMLIDTSQEILLLRRRVRREVRDAARVHAALEPYIAVLAPRGPPGVAHDPVVAARRVRAVAHHRDAVVRFRWIRRTAAEPLSRREDTPRVGLPLARRVERHRDRTNGGQRVHERVLVSTGNIGPVGDPGAVLTRREGAFLVLASVRVRRLRINAPLLLVNNIIEGVVHQATITSIAAVLRV